MLYNYILLPGSLTGSLPLKSCHPHKERIVVQPSFSRGELLNFGGVDLDVCI